MPSGLAAGVQALADKGITAAAFPADVGSPAAVKALVGHVRDKLGPVSVLHWNAYSRAGGDLLSADLAAIHNVFDVAVTGLLTAVQELLPRSEADPRRPSWSATVGCSPTTPTSTRSPANAT